MNGTRSRVISNDWLSWLDRRMYEVAFDEDIYVIFKIKRRCLEVISTSSLNRRQNRRQKCGSGGIENGWIKTEWKVQQGPTLLADEIWIELNEMMHWGFFKAHILEAKARTVHGLDVSRGTSAEDLDHEGIICIKRDLLLGIQQGRSAGVSKVLE